MDVLKNLDDFIKKDFNKTTTMQISNYKFIFPYNYIDNTYISDSSLNKYYKYYVKNQSSIIYDKKTFDMIEKLNNQKALEELRTEREKEKSKIYQNLLNNKVKKIVDFEEYTRINLKNYKKKLKDKKNSEEQGFNIIYALMKHLKHRNKKIYKKKKFNIIEEKSLLEKKRKIYNKLFNIQEDESDDLKYKNLRNNKKSRSDNALFDINISKINFNSDRKDGIVNNSNNLAELKNNDLIEKYSFSEKKIYKISNDIKYSNRRKNFQIEKQTLERFNKNYNKNSKENLRLVNSDKLIQVHNNNSQELFKLRLNKNLNIESNKNNSINSPKNKNDGGIFLEIEEPKKNNKDLNEKNNQFNNFKKISPIILKNNLLNKTRFKTNKKKLLEKDIKEISNKVNELSNLIINKKKEKFKYNIKNYEAKKIDSSSHSLNNYHKNKSENEKHKKKIKLNNINKIEYNINNIKYINKSEYKLPETNKYIFSNSKSKSDIIDNLKKSLVHEIKNQLIKKHSNDLLKIKSKEIIKKLYKKYRFHENYMYNSS